MEAKILRPLLWFGLLEHRSEEIPGSRFGQQHFYRKAELFERLLAFDVHVGPVGRSPALKAAAREVFAGTICSKGLPAPSLDRGAGFRGIQLLTSEYRVLCLKSALRGERVRKKPNSAIIARTLGDSAA